jgi:PIN domain nuclease of toxin-antitoxin system
MRLLLDTHALLWFMNDDAQLTQRARALMVNAAEIFVSSASIWEIAIKAKLGKLKADPDEVLRAIEENGILELSISNRHALAGGKLPLHHRDPFDRILIAQAILEQMRFLTSDSELRAYSDLVECI